MAGKGASEEYAGGELPPPVREWLARIAADRGLSEAELLRELAPGDGPGQAGPGPDESLERLDALAADVADAEERVAELESAIDETRDAFTDKIDDVRDRVIQIKRETDTKAPADHGHPEVEGELDALDTELDTILDEVGELESAIDAVDERMAAGFENFERVVRYLDETTDELDETVDRVIGGVNDLHRRLRTIEAANAERAPLSDLLSAANRHGATSAECGSCDRAVQLGLLTAPQCPHCESGFVDFHPKRGFFGSHTLETGDIPALTGEVARPRGAASNIVEVDESALEESDAPGDDATSEKPSFDAFGEDLTSDPSAGDADTVDGSSGDTADGTVDETASGSSDRRVESERADETPPGGGGDDESRTRDGSEPDSSDGTPLQSIDGVGPAYADRLRDAGVASAEELVDADAEALAAAVDVSQTRTERWIDRATGLVDGG